MADNNKASYEELQQRIQNLEMILKNAGHLNIPQFNLALHTANIGIHQWVIETSQFIWDEQLYKFWGLPFGSLLDLDLIFKGIHPDDRDYVKNTTEAFFKNSLTEDYKIQFRVIGIETGIERWLEFTGNMVSDNGKPERIFGIAVDITDRKKSEGSLKRWENVFHYAKWGIVVISATTNTFETINPEFADMLGYTIAELMDKPIEFVFPEEYRANIPVNIKLANEKGHHVWEAEHFRKDGSRFPVNIDITVVKNEHGVALYRIVSVTDISERKKVEKALQESENYYKYLFQNLNSNFAAHEIILDENGNPADYKFLEVNTAMEKATGITAAQMIGKTARELFPNTEQYWIDKFGEVALSGNSTVYENYSNELGRYYELKLYSPKKGQFAMLATDITERKLSEQKLKEAKEHFELLFNLNPDAVNIIRISDRHIVSVNDGFTKLLGYEYEEVVGKTLIELNLWVDFHERENIVQELLKFGYCENFEAHFRCKNGSQIVGIVSARVINIYGTEHFLTVTRDISLRKQFETALKESEKILKESQKIAELGSYKLNFLTGYWEGSEILDAIFGIDNSYEKSIEGWVNIIHPDWQKIMADYLQNEVITLKQKFDKEYKVIRVNDKKEIWIHGRGELWYDDNGTLHYMTGTIMDITSRKEAELLIQKQNKELQEMNATKDLLFSIIAHDLRSPLGSLLNSNQILAEALQNEDIQTAIRWTSAINKVSHQTFELLENLLEWFRVQTGQMTPSINQCNLKEIVDEVFALCNESAVRKGIFLENNVSVAMLAYFDKDMLKTVVRNLVNNAIKYTKPYGIVSVGCLTNQFSFEVIVSDNGVGVPQEMLPGLFSVNKNKSTVGTAKEKGSGLGLIICKDLVEIQGGHIWAESEVGKGSAFHFTIPRKH